MNESKDSFTDYPHNTDKEYVFFEKTIEWIYVKRHLNDFGSPLAGAHEKAGDAIVGSGGKFLIIEFKKSKAEFRDERKKYLCTRYDAKTVQAAREKKKTTPTNGRLIKSYSETRDLIEQEVRIQEGKDAPLPHVFVCGKFSTPPEALTASIDLEFYHYWGSWADPINAFDEGGIGPTEYEPLRSHSESNDLDELLISQEKGHRDDLSGYCGVKLDELSKYIARVIKAKGGTDEAAKGGWMYASVLGVAGNTWCITTLWEFASALSVINDYEKIFRPLTESFEKVVKVAEDDRPAPSDDPGPSGTGGTPPAPSDHQAEGPKASAATPSPAGHKQKSNMTHIPPYSSPRRRV